MCETGTVCSIVTPCFGGVLESEAARVRARPGNSTRVLLVDEDMEVLQVLRLAITCHGYEVAAASSLFEASTAIGQRDFSLGIVDLALGDGDGSTLLARLRARLTPVLILSGYLDERRVHELLRAGAIRVMPKPVDRAGLMVAVDDGIRLGQGWRKDLGRMSSCPRGDVSSLVALTKTQDGTCPEVERKKPADSQFSKCVHRLAQEYRLSSAEKDVLSRLLQGMSPETVAMARHVAVGTIRKQVQSILRKFAVHTLREVWGKLAALFE